MYIIRSGDDWLVGEEEKDALLKASVGVDLYQPPRRGWLFHNKGEFEEDDSLICTKQPESVRCNIRVSLSGDAIKFESTGLISMGREVSKGYDFFYNFIMISLAGVQTGWKH